MKNRSRPLLVVFFINVLLLSGIYALIYRYFHSDNPIKREQLKWVVFSFAVMTYQLLTGHKPFERNNTWAMIRSHLEEPPPDPRQYVDLPETAASALLKALTKKPEERFAAVGEFVAELRSAC